MSHTHSNETSENVEIEAAEGIVSTMEGPGVAVPLSSGIIIGDDDSSTVVKLTLDKKSLEMTASGEKETITATFEPDDKGPVVWSVNNTDGAISYTEQSETNSIEVTPLKSGFATITASIANGLASEQCEIMVDVAVIDGDAEEDPKKPDLSIDDSAEDDPPNQTDPIPPEPEEEPDDPEEEEEPEMEDPKINTKLKLSESAETTVNRKKIPTWAHRNIYKLKKILKDRFIVRAGLVYTLAIKKEDADFDAANPPAEEEESKDTSPEGQGSSGQGQSGEEAGAGALPAAPVES